MWLPLCGLRGLWPWPRYRAHHPRAGDLGRVLNDQLVGQSCRAEAQDVPRDQLHRHVLNVALVDKRAVAGVKVLKDEAALVLVEFDEGMVVVYV